MWFSLSDQTAYFLWSVVLGLILGAAYDLVRAVRMLVKARGAHVILSDVFFFAVCGVITSLFALPFNKGNVRGFIIFGEAVGFLAYRLTLGSIMGRIYAFIAQILRRIIQKIHKILEKIFRLLLKMTAVIVYNISVVIDKSVKRHREHRAAAKSKKHRRQNKDRQHEQKRKQKSKHKTRKRAQ